MGSITRKQIRGQLKRDLIGKDSHRGVTLTYSWLANQFGHFSLGFIPTFILFLIIQTPDTKKQSALMAALYVSLLWLVFELYNFLGPLLLKRKFKSVVRFRKKVIFKPALRNIGYDTFTDLLFFWFGACLASLTLSFSLPLMVVALVLLAIIIRASMYWYVTKIYMQAAQFPFHIRLGQWEKYISEENKDAVERFRKNPDSGNHLLVFGPGNTGKSSLCIGLATEISIAHGTCFYTTVMKLFALFFEPPEALNTSDSFWTWRSASLLIIDDINAGDPVEPDVVSPDTFLGFLRNDNIKDTAKRLKKANMEAFKEKNVIWVLGNESHAGYSRETWENFVSQLGVDKEKITVISLTAEPDTKQKKLN